MSTLSKVLVTGATGFIGRYLINQFLKEGLQGQSIELLLVCHNKNKVPREWFHRCDILESNLCDLLEHRKRFFDVNYVIHLAANRSFFGDTSAWDENVSGTRTLLESLSEASNLKRFLFASTIGAVDRAPHDLCTEPLTEDSPLYPSSLYGDSKKECEVLVKQSGFTYTILRIPWCYGVGMSPDSHIRVFIDMVRRRHPVTFFNWPGRVTLLEVKNCARLIRSLCVDPSATNQIYLSSDGTSLSIGKLFQEIGILTGHRAGKIPIPRVVVSTARLLRRWIPFNFKSLFFFFA